MPVGTVRGRFELDAPALRTLKELERQGIRTQGQMKRLGDEMDRVGGVKSEEQLTAYDQKLRDVKDTSDYLHRSMRADWVETTRVVKAEVKAQVRELDFLSARMDALSAKRITPQVDVDGVAEANAQLTELDRRLAAFGRRHATATASVRRTGGGGPALSGPPAGSMLPGGAGPRAPNVGSSLGGGGGGRRGGRVIDFGMRGIRPRTALMAAGAGFARPLIGGAGALLGSAYEGALGGGALAATGYGTAALGGGLAFAAAKPMATQMQAAYKAEVNLSKAIAVHGANSTSAATAQAQLNMALKQAPKGTRGFLKELTDFRQAWAQASRGAQSNLLGGARGFLGGVRQGFRPTYGPAAGVVTGAIQREGTRFGQFLGTDRTVHRGVTSGAGMFAENLPYVRRDSEAIVRMWLNLMRAMRPFFRDFNHDVTRVLEDWAKRSQDQERLRGHLRQDLDSLKTWVRLAGAAYRLTRDLLHLGAPSGNTLLGEMTGQLNTWDRQVRRNPEQVRRFFRESVSSVKSLAGALKGLIGTLNNLLRAIQPTLDALSGLVALGTQTGVLGTPGGLGALYGAYRGARGFGGGGGRGGGGGGFMGLGVGGAELAAGGAAYGGYRGLRGARTAVAAGARPTIPVGGVASNRYGSVLERPMIYNGVPGAAPGAPGVGAGRFVAVERPMAGPVSQLGRTRLLGSRTLARGAGLAGRYGPMALRGAARAYLPIATVLAVGAASRRGLGPGARVQSALSSVDPTGSIHMPMSGADARASGNDAADKFLQQHPRIGARGIRGAMRSLITTPFQGHLADTNISRFGELKALATRDGGVGDAARSRVAEYQALLKIERQVAREEKTIRDARQRQHADKMIVDEAKAYDILAKKLGPKSAIRTWMKDYRADLRQLGPAGRKELGRAGAKWVAQMRENGQITNAQARRMNRSIVQDFADMGQKVKIINGKIYTDSDKQWKNIADQLGSHAERARQRVTDAFTAIQREAMNQLTAMGFSRGEAKHLVQMGDNSKRGQRDASAIVKNRNDPLSGGAFQQRRGGPMGTRVRQRGGRIEGHGLRDTVNVAAGYRAAPGELIVNRHTERRVNQFLGGGTTLAREVQKEQRGHSQALRDQMGPTQVRGKQKVPGTDMYAARGARVAAGLAGAAAGGRGLTGLNLMGAKQGLSPYAAIAKSYGLGVVSGARPGSITVSGNVSLHSSGDAIDVSGSGPNMRRYAMFMSRRYGAGLDELIHTPIGRMQIKNGQHYVYTGAVASQHYNHVHVGDKTPGGARGLPGGIGGALAAGVQSINLRQRRSGLAGLPGTFADRAISMYRAGTQRHVNRRLGSSGGGGAAPQVAGKYNVNQLMKLWIAAGGPPSVARLMAAIAMAESGGDPGAHNPSGATGLWQILGAVRPGNLRDPMVNAQNAVAKYRAGGTHPWDASRAVWARRSIFMQKGGRINRPDMRFAGFLARGGSFIADGATGFVAGEGKRKERVNVTPIRPKRRPAHRGRFDGGGGGAGGPEVHLHFHGDVHAGSREDLDRFTTKVQDAVGKALSRYLEDDVTADEELAGG